MFFFFNDTATTEIYTLSLHDALPISGKKLKENKSMKRRFAILFAAALLVALASVFGVTACGGGAQQKVQEGKQDRKSTRLNSSHANISYAVFCLKKKKTNKLRLTISN